jgi:hypothetical protein
MPVFGRLLSCAQPNADGLVVIQVSNRLAALSEAQSSGIVEVLSLEGVNRS